MKIRHKGSSKPEKIEIQMTPMIDIVFQLLVFFIMTFKIVDQEGDFNIRMPAMGAPQDKIDEVEMQTMKVRLEAAADGRLAAMKLNGETIVAAAGQSRFGDTRFDALHAKIRAKIQDDSGPVDASAMEVEFDCDYKLRYSNVIDAITAVSGYKKGSGSNAQTIKLIEKIKFAQPKKKPGT